MEFVNNTLFKQKILSFTLMQVIGLSFLLVVSVAVRIMFFPHNYLEPVPMYVIVGYFFLGELLQLLYLTHCVTKTKGKGCWHRLFGNTLVVRGIVSVTVGTLLCLFLTGQHLFLFSVFLLFFVAELAFDWLYYGRSFRAGINV